MKWTGLCLVLLAVFGHTFAADGDVVEVGGVDTIPGGEGGGGGDNEIDVSGVDKGGREEQTIPDDGLLPKWCASPVGQKCDVAYDIGVTDEASAVQCLLTCQLKSCLSAQFHNGQCMLSSQRCDTTIPGEGTNYFRLKEGEEGQCPSGTSPIGLKEFEPINDYCKGIGVECPGDDIIPSRFTPTLRQCVTDCNVQLKCLTVHYRDKICHLRGNRCTKDQLIAAPGAIDLYRLTKGETCPPERPPYVAEKLPYTGKFCMIKDKTCPGHNLYRKPQRINPLEKCLVKCNKINTCGSVEFVNNKCVPKDYRCSDDELVDAPGTLNLMRLMEGEKCPGNRTPPPTLKPWSGRFCSKSKRECPGNNMKDMPVDAATMTDCLTKCVKSDGCATVFYKDGKCTLKDKNCDAKDLKLSDGDTYYRLRAGEACPEPTPPPTCGPNSSYNPEASACPNTCADKKAEEKCEVESVSGCQCDDGFVKADDSDQCIPISECGCKTEEGDKYGVGAVWSSPNCDKKFECLLDSDDTPQITPSDMACGENEECDGKGSCVCKKGYKEENNKCVPEVDCGDHSTFDPEASATPNTCAHPALEATSSETKPGCPCNSGYILDKTDGKCVAFAECGCVDEKQQKFPTGDDWLNEDCTKKRKCEGKADGPPQIEDTDNTCPANSKCKAETGRGECACEEGYTMQTDGTCKPDKECASPTVYNPKGSLCPNTCQVPDRSSSCENTGPSCDCPAGYVLNDADECIKAPECPCYDSTGQERKPGDEWLTPDCGGSAKCVADGDNVPKLNVTDHSCKENAVCDRTSGFSQCVCAEKHVLSNDGESCVPEVPPCEEQLRDKVKTFMEDILAILAGGCGSCSDTCQNPNGSKNCPSTSKICSCGQKNFLYDNVVGKCIPANECGCYDDQGVAHPGGSSWLSNNCQHKLTCDALGSGAPTVTSVAFQCDNCDGSGQCFDNEPSVAGDPNTTGEGLQNSAVEN